MNSNKAHRKKVVSSNINSVGYNKEKTLLEVEFFDGSVYQYYPVSEDVYDEIMTSDSICKTFNQKVKSNKSIAYKKMS